MDRLYVYSVVPVVAVGLLLASSALLHGKGRARGLAAYCLAVAVWAAALGAAFVPATRGLGGGLAATGGFVVAAYFHAAAELLGLRARGLLVAAYGVAAAIAAAHLAAPGLIYDPAALGAGPLFWPSMGLALVAALLPVAGLLRAVREARSASDRRLLAGLATAGGLGYAGAAATAVMLAHGVTVPAGLLLVLASLFVLSSVVRARMPAASRRLLERSAVYAAVVALLSSAFLLGVLTLAERSGEPLVAEYRLAALFLLFMAALAFEPLRQHLGELLGRPLAPGTTDAGGLAEALAAEEGRADQARRLAELGTFASAVAHEVRGPLGVMKARVALAERRGLEPEDGTALREQIDRASRFVDDLLAYGRPRPLALRETALAPLVRLAFGEARAGLGGASGEVELELVEEPAGLEAEVDGGQLRAALAALFENALLALEGREERRVRARIRAEETAAAIDVEDSGPGLPEAIRPRLFEPFVTGRGREGPKPGTGLGLAIVRGILERHGGAVRAGASDLGGARFELRIPREASPALAAAAEEDG